MAKHYDLFISYTNTDRAWVEGYLLVALKQAGVNYHSEASFALGTVRIKEFETAIQHSHRTLLVISPGYLADGFNQFIDLLAQCYGLDTATWPVIPLILHPVQLPPRLSILVKLNATNPEEWEEAIERLCADLKRPVPAPLAHPSCPYPGMMPFSEEMSDRFFGRDSEIQDCLESLRLHPFLAVIGPSGSGKSSLIFAGLIPKLQQTGLFGGGEWLIRTLRPGEQPLVAFKAVLGIDPITIDNWSPSQNLLLLVDQFEEVFTLAQGEVFPFEQALLNLITTPNCYVILTVRADFYPELMESSLWRQIQFHRLEVVPLNDEGLRQAILKPADDVGVFVEPALLERLIVDGVGEPGVLPLIQETLVLLWERLERRFLPLKAYEALILPRSAYGGDSQNKRTGLQVAIARRADAALASLTDEQQRIARRIFLRLIQFGEGRADTRRQQLVEALQSADDPAQLFEQTLRHLANCRLLTLSGEENRNRKVDIAHEALISGWPTLQKWISDRREAEQIRRRLEVKTQEWLRLGQGSGGLLDEVELAEAERWLNSNDATELGFDKSLRELVEVSDRTLQEAKEREEKARRRELELLSEKLNQEKKARQSAQARNLIAGISIILLASLTALIIKQNIEAQTQTINALTAFSDALLNSNKQLDALREAIKAGNLLKKERSFISTDVKMRTLSSLWKTVYETQEINRLQSHRNRVNTVRFSPDGEWLVTTSKDQTIKIWKRDGTLVTTIDKTHAYSANFSPDGQMIASASPDKTVKLWDLEGKLLKTFLEHQDIVYDVNFSPDGQIIASASADKTIKIWNLDGKVLKTFTGHQDKVYSVRFSPDGKKIASASADKTIKLWNLDGKVLRTFSGHQNDVIDVNFSPDSNFLVSASYDNSIKIWDLINGKMVKNISSQKSFMEVVFSPNGQTIAAANADGTIMLWSRDGTLLQTFRGHQDAVASVRFSPDGKTIASSSDDRTVRIWKVAQEKPMIQAHKSLVRSVKFSPDSQVMASVSDDKTIKLWNRQGKLLHTLEGHQDLVKSVSFSPDNQLIASASKDSTVKLWNKQGKLLKNLQGHKGFVTSVNFSPDSKTIVSASEDGTIKLWSLEGKLIQTINAEEVLSYVTFLTDGNRLLSVSTNGVIKIWRLDGQLITTFTGKGKEIITANLSPNGKIIVLGSKDGTVKLLTQEGEEIPTFNSHSNWVIDASFSPDSKIIASASADKAITLWSLDGRPIQTFQGNQEILSVSFSPDGNMMASGNIDGTVTLWNFDLEDLLKRGCDRLQSYLKTSSSLNPNDQNLCTDYN
ncbi:nSTAND1 domain-containing NTPase [Planktothrix agardhii]|uniref:nSTAND1 domain-containing NTPase n=1 Tax=Planktothrix agardhii TaxID=1160 RepID=UPI0020A7A3CA|nr:TIR domain-containing protein [Planktothrix agardhii]CAD5912013.1 putative WD repeat-containing protein all2124 [Planktothrix agardhii]